MQPSTRIQGRQLQMAATIPAYTYVLQGSMVTYESPPIMESPLGWFFFSYSQEQGSGGPRPDAFPSFFISFFGALRLLYHPGRMPSNITDRIASCPTSENVIPAKNSFNAPWGPSVPRRFLPTIYVPASLHRGRREGVLVSCYELISLFFNFQIFVRPAWSYRIRCEPIYHNIVHALIMQAMTVGASWDLQQAAIAQWCPATAFFTEELQREA